MKFLKNSKGFTLAEMLIVMAVVVVLAAAAIPSMTTTLESAREANDADAARAAYVQAYTQAYLDYNNDGAFKDGGYAIDCEFQQNTSGWTGNAPKIDSVALPSIDKTKTKLTFTFAAEGTDGDIALAATNPIVAG